MMAQSVCVCGKQHNSYDVEDGKQGMRLTVKRSNTLALQRMQCLPTFRFLWFGQNLVMISGRKTTTTTTKNKKRAGVGVERKGKAGRERISPEEDRNCKECSRRLRAARGRLA